MTIFLPVLRQFIWLVGISALDKTGFCTGNDQIQTKPQNPLDHPLPQLLFPTGPYRKSFPEPCGLLCGLLVFHLFSVLLVWHCLLSCAVIKWTVYAVAIAVVLVTRLICKLH